MKWIKLNYDRFLLAVFALALLVCAGLLINNARSFNDVFNDLKDRVPQKQGLGVSVDQKGVTDEEGKLATPDQWLPRTIGDPASPRRLPLFVSVPYISNPGPDGVPVKVDPLENNSVPIHPPVDNKWLLDHKQDLLAPNVLEQDSDGDGFSTLDEFNGHTDPDNKESHPPYYSKLFLKRFVRVPFRLLFEARNGNTYLLNTVDEDQTPTQFVHLNDIVKLKDRKYKVTKFEEKFDSSQGFKKDVSELTLVNVENGQVVVLPKQIEVDSPTTYAVLSYLWVGTGAKPEFAVLKDAEFTLKPDDNTKYKVLELSDQEVRIFNEAEKKELHVRAQTR